MPPSTPAGAAGAAFSLVSVAGLALPALVALAGAGVPALVLHLALAHAMRARGLPRWRVADTLLVSPLLFLSLFTAFAALAHAVAVSAPGADGAGLAASLLVAAGAFVAAGFGARAVGKLY